MKIPVSYVKKIREEIGASHLIIFAVSPDGANHVATHGESPRNARQAAVFGNKLKKELGFPADLCRSTTIERICKKCSYWKPDYGTWCFNGWTGDGTQGHCHLEPTPISKPADSICSHFMPND